MESNNVKLTSDCRVLIVDDEKNLCDMLKETLIDQYQVEVCYSANEAFRAIKSNNYDIVISDLKLEDGTGIDVLKLAKEKDKFTEVIIITGFGTLEVATDAINLGVTSFLNKPLKITDFSRQVERAAATRIFHLRSLQLLTHSDYREMPEAKEHILDITSLYYFTTKLICYLDVSDVMKIILEEVNYKLGAKYSVIGVNYLKFSEIFTMPRMGHLNSADVIDSILTVWDDSFAIFEKEDFKNEQITFNTYSGNKIQQEDKIDNTSFGCVVSLPMTVLGETIGFIAIFGDDDTPLSKERNQFFSVFASLISSAVQHCYMDMLAKHQAKTDSLTGVANHRMFHEILEREMARSNRYKRQFCLAILDIDDFKKINDTYGHLVGDGVLVDLTKRILKIIRGGDFLARYGGEEFGIVLTDTDLAGAEKLAKRVCHALAETPFIFSNTEIYYTVSMGLINHTGSTRYKKDTLIRLADEALYKAKREGKNRAVISQSKET